MKNPIRRNKNIGTAKQGHGQNNKLVIPYPAVEMKSFYERLGNYKTIVKEINGHQFKFVIEETREHSFHACTLEDVEVILKHIPKKDYGELELIILRQPSRKEEKLNPVWGRLIYSYEFEKKIFPAIILEAIDLKRSFKWDKKLSIAAQKELERLKEDGHEIVLGKRHFEGEYKLENIRATQLYRTLPHEFGHYVHYLEVVEQPTQQGEDEGEWEKRWDSYFSLPSSEKEVFAHNYADNLKQKLIKEKVIPFASKLDESKIVEDGLNLKDFKN